MANRKITLGLLALVGGLTIVGSGFSAWYFGDNNLNVASNVDAHVTPLAGNFGTITPVEVAGLQLQLDQGGYENRTNLEAGISFHEGTSGVYNGTIGATYSIDGNKSLNALNAGLKGTFECVVTIKEEFAKYVEFKADTFVAADDQAAIVTSTASSIKLSKNITFGVALDSKFTFNLGTNADLSNKALKYVNGMKPQNQTSFNDLYDLNENNISAISFSYSLNVTAK